MQVVGVADELRDDLPEPERHDRQVVPAQPQGRQADQDAADRRDDACDQEHEPDRNVDAGLRRPDANRTEVEIDLLELAGGEPAGRVSADCVEGDVAEIEQPRVADDDVQTDGHDDEDEDGDRVVDGREGQDHRDVRRQVGDVEGIRDRE